MQTNQESNSQVEVAPQFDPTLELLHQDIKAALDRGVAGNPAFGRVISEARANCTR